MSARARTFVIRKEQSYLDWNKYCVEALKRSKEEIRQRGGQCYRSVTDKVKVLIRFLQIYGWPIFVGVVGCLVGVGAGVAVGIAIGGVAGAGIGLAALPVVAGIVATLVHVRRSTVDRSDDGDDDDDAVEILEANGGRDGAFRTAWKLYKNRELMVKIKRLLEPYKTRFDRLQPGSLPSNRRQLNYVFIECCHTIIRDLYEAEIMLDGKVY
ncbi:unnamed protein product [Didymodactylos carnosus]|uniref:Uncharacterized protein n=1 Tax=Didymodactylos carnosus TaxID=1234261 RepID=A0A815WG18_9BILA|nr:unnamed protein product [Didymodactylos carnosus]CAF4401856.1 unnamed protein product [Didymodactylos carnosus]